MPKVFIYLAFVIMLSIITNVGKSLFTEKLYYDKLCNGVVNERQIRVLTILKCLEVISYIAAGIGLLSAIIYMLIVVHIISV